MSNATEFSFGVQPRIQQGRQFPLGAYFDGTGTNFAIFSEKAEFVELCLFDEESNETRVRLPGRTRHTHHGYIEGMGTGQRYGFRVYGPFDPARGLRFNPAKLLVDPYAKALDGRHEPSSTLPFSYVMGNDDTTRDERDSAPAVSKGLVVQSDFDWEDDQWPLNPWQETTIYELHVKGFTALRTDLPPEIRGTYAGIASSPVIDHLLGLGVTAVELLPVHAFIDEKWVVERGLKNYWGYNTLNFFSLARRYSSTPEPGGEIHEFKNMVKTLHRAGIEVILDVVYNHTAEGSELGPTLSFRGIDNDAYYRLDRKDPRRYLDFTGCGNTVNARHPQVLKLIMDSLRYWVLEMHVDGFRFDLAPTLAREEYAVERLSSFFDVIHQDPVISHVKLIAEPWDLGEGGYHVGNFPVLWSEWNGRYRDTVRSFWRGEGGMVSDLAYRLTGSSDLFGEDGRHPWASVNFVTCHDGFTLNDLVSYSRKHNEMNNEGNLDGSDYNRSWNCGVEGETSSTGVLELRARQRRNFLATLLLSNGVPMLTAGDEIGRTQRGNNNAYCQDNEISWVDWELDSWQNELHDFTKRLSEFRRDHPLFRRKGFFMGRRDEDTGLKDVIWLRSDGNEMTSDDWRDADQKKLGVLYSPDSAGEREPDANTGSQEEVIMFFNAGTIAEIFTLPAASGNQVWTVRFDTANVECEGKSRYRHIRVEPHSMVVLTRPADL